MNIRGARHLRSERRGQALPLTVLALGVIVGCAALTVDVGRVYALRNQSNAATTAAALAASQAITDQLNQQVAANPTVAPSITQISKAAARSAAYAVYKDNIQTAIPNSGLSAKPAVAINAITQTYLATLSASESQALSPYEGTVLISVTAAGTTPMYFGGVVGVPTASVHVSSTSDVGIQAGVAKSQLLPLAMPATGDQTGPDSTLPVPSDNQWEQNIQTGDTFFVYRGDSGNTVPPPPSGTPTPYTAINYLGLFGAGNDGLLQYGSSSWVTVGSTATLSGQTGSSGWNTFSNLTPGETIWMPVGNSTTNGSGTITIIGFITATVDGVNNMNGADAGFSFTVQNPSATVPLSLLQGETGSSSPYSPTFFYQLIAAPN